MFKKNINTPKNTVNNTTHGKQKDSNVLETIGIILTIVASILQGISSLRTNTEKQKNK